MLPEDIDSRFWSKVNILESDSCWEWTDHVDSGNYGRFKINGKSWKASRVAWTLINGEIPAEGKNCVCHSCDNPICVNPNHLFLGSIADNNLDRDKKGRVASGERQARSKLTLDDVENIRSNKMNLTQTELGDIFEVKQNTISSVINKVNWK